MTANTSFISSDSAIIYAEQLSKEPSPRRNNTPEVLKSMEVFGVPPREAITISTVDSPGPRFITINSDSNDPTTPYDYGRVDPIIPPSLNDLKLRLNPLKIKATMAVIQADPTTYDKNYSPQSPELSEVLPISTAPINISTIDS